MGRGLTEWEREREASLVKAPGEGDIQLGLWDRVGVDQGGSNAVITASTSVMY